jgi:adenylylsulfate kinase-like enzyme
VCACEAARGQQFHEVYVKADSAACEQRNPKGPYRRASSGESANFTGISSPYEPPLVAQLSAEPDKMGVEDCVAKIVGYVKRHFRLRDRPQV